MAKKVIKSINLLPEFLKTDKNNKFLSSTIDQLIQQPQVERLSGYVGSKLTPNYNSTSDIYISETSLLREAYQLTPSLVVKDVEHNVKDIISFDDLVNSISFNGGLIDNLSRLFDSNTHAFNPNIDWDKFTNYQEYYWLTTGPDTIVITGQQRNSTSTYVVRDNDIGTSFIFNPNGIEEDPLITLYRGSTYNFDINSRHKFYIKTTPTTGQTDLYNSNVINNGISTGTLTIRIDEFTPTTLFYVSGDNLEAQGQFSIKTIEQDSFLNVETEILGKKNYVSGNGVPLSNGMKIRFGGEVFPESYQNKEFFVEGVGTEIKLVDYNLLLDSTGLSSLYNDNFDSSNFDNFPFDNFKRLPIDPEYITINRASRDINPWSRYNRWVHGNVIRAAAIANGKEPVYPNDKRARRPIIEFNPNIKLYNFGVVGSKNVDLIDNSTTDAFSFVEGTAGYYVDGVLLEQGHRVIFNADTDPLVRGKIYEVNYLIINSKLRLELNPTSDHVPQEHASICVSLGDEYEGTSWWFNGDKWQFAQQKLGLNQPPLFDLFDRNGISYSDSNYYSSDFKGNKIFGYDIGQGSNDPILGFPLKYKNTSGVGSYLFKNYFVTEKISISRGFQDIETVPSAATFFRITTDYGIQYNNIWSESKINAMPILQFQVLENSTSTIEINSINVKNVNSTISVGVTRNNKKVEEDLYSVALRDKKYYVDFNFDLLSTDNILLKIYTNASNSNLGYYDVPLSLTNNPLNGNIDTFTLSEITDHVETVVEKSLDFRGSFPGANNLRDLGNLYSNGTRLISNAEPISFAAMFIGKREHSLITAITKASDDYNQFKLSLLQKISEIDGQLAPSDALDLVLKEINKDKDTLSSYYYSDMLGYTTDKIVRTWTVTDIRSKVYPLTTEYNRNTLSLRSVLIYKNTEQLILDKDYEFVEEFSAINILASIVVGDTIKIVDYIDTSGSFVPPTPTKLGLYPKYIPEKYSDNTYVNGPKNVIQCHDGSILLAYNDYRDDILLEYEKRVYNNIKGSYKKDLLDILSLIPNVFREGRYSNKEFIEIYQQDFIRWAGLYAIDYSTNSSFDSVNPFTWNYTGSYSEKLNKHFEGSWRAVYKNVYDTDRPHTHPWEMLGLTEKPIWWDEEYGSAPYTQNNEILWEDIENGLIKHGPGAGINKKYAKPGLSKFIPVDTNGNLVSPIVNLLTNITAFNIRQNWKAGDISPAENAWRRSSFWPFAVQKALALMFPSTYASLMYDPYHLNKNKANQWVYDKNLSFLDLKNIYIFGDNGKLTSGYSVYVSEIGKKRNINYLTELKSDLLYCDFNLTHKVGGFVSKDKLQLIIDSYDPTSTSQQGLLPNENYSVILNTSNPVKSIGISGIVIQKNNGKYIVKGYDIIKPYFTIYKALRNINTSAITIGGVSESYVRWTESTSGGGSGLTGVDVTTANASITGKFYKQGQIVLYGNKFYRTKVSHQSGTSFNTANFQLLPSLPTVGGATVQLVSKFDKKTEIKISYGTEFGTIQEVYDFILGYGEWLTDQGFIFDQHNVDVNNVLDWNFSAKEFLYWTTQNWVDSSVITLSPFADKIKFNSENSIIDNFFDSFYDYSILEAGGIPLSQNKINVSRQDSICTVETLSEFDNIYFARFIAVQKEHIIIFDNTSLFNDVIYDIETGYRQRRIKFLGFRTSNWNGDYFSPGFVFDSANISNWKEYKNYNYGDIVKFANKYYTANKNIVGSQTFDFTLWTVLRSKPESQLLPNFDYKISQFEDFYSLDIDNFDSSQQKLAQHLTGYTPRPYLNNIFTNPISQYKFYQGFIKEKGTKNSVERLAKASIKNLQGEISFTEEWAFRIGYYGGYQTSQEIEIVLPEDKFIENPQILNFVDQVPTQPNDLILYTTASNVLIKPDDYNASTVFLVNNNEFSLTTAGYVRTDDVTATAYNENSILDIANNSNIQEGNTIWLGFKSNGSWDVLKYTIQDFKVIEATIDVTNLIITFVTDKHHNLKAKDIISVIQFNNEINGVYIVDFVVNLNTFIVKTNISPSETDITGVGLVFKFVSVRFNNFDSIFSDSELLNLQYGSNVWIDNSGNGTWQVLQKTKNYSDPTTAFGWSISKRSGSDIIVTGDTDYFQNGSYGRILLYKLINNSLRTQLIYSINSNNKVYYSSSGHTQFGKSLVYDDINFNNSNFGLIVAGAPSTSNIKSNSSLGGLRVASSTGTTSTYAFEGLVKISSVDPILIEELTQQVLLSPNPASHENFGHSLYVQRNSNSKLLLVGAPFSSSTGTGKVYSYRVNSSTSTVNIVYNSEITTSTSFSVGSQWGYAINGTDDAKIIAVSAPGYASKSGCVLVYTGTNTTYLQTLISPFGVEGEFGSSIRVSNNGNYLFVGAPRVLNDNQSYGKVAVYSVSSLTNTCTLVSVLSNPVPGPGMEFGKTLEINQTEDILLVSAIGTHRYVSTMFDDEENTVFDSNSTYYSDDFPNSGVVYRYERKNARFVLADKIYQEVTTSTNFGLSLCADSTALYTGAHNVNSPGYLYKFTLDSSVTPWNILRSQDNLTDLSTVQKISLLDSFNERIVDYLDVIDPLKGKISSLADQELKYKSAFDPAIYSIGSSLTVNDSSSSWIDDHVGELWWDLSTVKYLWYEQGDLIYRKNNWGSLFPGATIDVYEWVSSEYLPSEWSSLADTPEGLTTGISGQPKYVDNTVVSVKQVFNPVTNSFVDRYYFWVKNKVILPNAKNRRLSAYQVAAIIANPTSYGLRYAAILSADALSLTNIGPLLISDRMHLNILLDEIDNKIPRHTEWLLLEEGSSQSVPNFTLEKKLIDSLLGHDNLGNLVPDPALSERKKYGVEIRPRQTLFKNRIEALRNLIEFTNSVLEKNLITSNYNFKNLNQQEPIPDEFSGEYDLIVEDNEALLVIDTRPFQRAELTCTVKDGKIRSVTIINPGAGYRLPPKVKISDTNSTASIETEIDDKGKVIGAIIKDSGSGFTVAPLLEVRPHTVVVLVDSLYSGKWTKFAYDYAGTWVRSATQKYNTTLYWHYIDWVSSTYNPYVDYEYTIDDVYELNMLTDLLPGQYVKVKNGGDGRAVILEKTASGVQGTFGDGYNIVYSQNGTIQLSESLWNVTTSNNGFDQENTFDQTLFDQTPDLELQYIITAIKEDIFINDLKINWNLFFFKAVKYALSEQKILDWAFKTSFINVKNNAGLLDQRSVYKLQNSEYYEDYLKEVKPYHTVIRNFTTNYTYVEPTRSYTTDFDLPAVYNKTEGKFDVVSINDPIIDTYPWKSWKDNYAFSIEEIAVGFPGSGYTYPPVVQINTAPGDTGSGAEAKAYIRSGQVVYIELTKIGTGYKVAPEVLLIGGGDTKLVQAKAYARLTNKKVRTNMVGMKFDRTSKRSEIDTNLVTDTFYCNGSDNSFVLNWLAVPDKFKITVKVDQTVVLSSDYTIEYYKVTNNNYTKNYNKIIFLNFVPGTGQLLEITYVKNINLYNAVDRIINYYEPTSGMPGNNLSQLMYGIDYPKTKIEALTFDYTTKWDINYAPFDSFAWADEIGYYTKTTIANTATAGVNTLTLSTLTGITVGQSINIISYITNKFNTTTDVIITAINTGTKTITFNSTLTGTVVSGDTIEFWSYDSNSNILDSIIDGGTWSQTTSNYYIGALGINPEDIIIQGDGFLTPSTSYAPEELVPGQVMDAVALNVYTKNPFGSPMVYSNSFYMEAETTATEQLSFIPPNKDSITVTWNGTRLYGYTTSTTFTSREQYTINWVTGEIIVPPQLTEGYIGYTIVSIGGGKNDTEAGVLDVGFAVTNNETEAQVQSIASYVSVKSAYVTVDGISISAITTTTDYGYMLSYAREDNRRAAVTVYNLPPGQHSVQVWFFANAYGYFNEVREQLFTTPGFTQSAFTLNYPPANIQPGYAQMIVEVSDNTGRRILLPPYINYYQVSNSINTTFSIDSKGFYPAPPTVDNSWFNFSTVKVFLNGTELVPGFNYSISSANRTVTINSGILSPGDVLAVVSFIRNNIADTPIISSEKYYYDYSLNGNILSLVNGIANATLRVITFTNHDGMLIQTERFKGNVAKRYKISRPILNDRYVWVQVNGIPLTSREDYEVLDDQLTIQISEQYEHDTNDEIVIMSLSSREFATTVLGYRIFNDIFNRTHFKRLSKSDTTYLAKPLYFTDTEIHVADATALTPPVPSNKIPGIVLINGERIEFLEIQGNVLKKLRRATLGTSSKFYVEVNSKVIDHSPTQTIPFTERILKQTHITTSTTNTYTISTSSSTLIGDGIRLSTATSYTISTGIIDTALARTYAETALKMVVGLIPVDIAYDLNGDSQVTLNDAIGYLRLSNGVELGYTPNPLSNYTELIIKEQVSFSPIHATDQVMVYYGGRLLNKVGTYYADITKSYYGEDYNLVGTTATILGLQSILNPQINDSYVVNDTNQVWIYKKSSEIESYNGFVYKGLNYLPPEFSINTSTQALTLNIRDGLKEGIKLTIIKKELDKDTLWNDEVTDSTSLPLFDSTSIQAKFIKARPAELPDNYYFGGDPAITTDSGLPLTDDNGNTLEGL